MTIENRNLEPGTRLIATYKKETYRALVVAGPEGKALYQPSPYDGRGYKSPSALGTAVTGKACNGWTFWSIDSGPEEQSSVEETEAQNLTGQQEAEEDVPEPVVAAFRRVPNQRGVPDGAVRLYCDACQGSFNAAVGHQPERCPQGHRPGDAASEEQAQS